MSKTLDANQQRKIDRPFLQPIYFVHILDVGAGHETLYFSDRTFSYNGHDYEDYLSDLPSLAQSIERFGGYLNVNAQLMFKNQKFRVSNTLLEWFDTNPITRKEMELYVLYIDTGETFGADVSTKLARLGIGELRNITRQSFQSDLCTILHLLDQKNVLYRINRTDWPNADPKVIGQVGNIIYGSVKDIPCHCIKTGPYSTLAADITAVQINVPLTEVSYPIAFSAPGTMIIDSEEIRFAGVDAGTRKLTSCVRGYNATVAAVHKMGTPVLGKLASYKWMIAAHSMKSISAVKVDRVLIPATDYTVDLNDGGRTTVLFGIRQIMKHQGSHGHPSTAVGQKYFTGATATATPGTGGWSTLNTVSKVIDKDSSTFFRILFMAPQVPIPAAQFITTTFTIPVYSGPKASAVFLCVIHKTTIFSLGTYWCTGKVIAPQIIPLDSSGIQKSERLKLSSNIPPTTVKINIAAPAGARATDNDGISSYLYEVWLEIETAETGAAAAGGVFSKMDDVFSPIVSVDGEGYKDDGGGTYTGVGNSLIENPSDVRRHFLIAVLGRVIGDLDAAEFTAMRAFYLARFAGGYKVSSILNRLSETPSEILSQLDFETRSMLREDGGLFHLAFLEAIAPTSVLTLTKDNLYGEPVFGQTPIDELRNSFRSLFDIDWSQGKQNNHYLSEFMQSAADSDGTSITKYGELIEDLEFKTTKIPAQVNDVIDWVLTQKKDVLKTVHLEADHAARILEKGDYFTLTWDFWTGLKWRVLSIDENPASQGFTIDAVQYPI